MDIERVIQLLRESKKKAKCPPGFKYSKKMKSCVPIKKKGKKYGYGVRGYYMGGYGRGGYNRPDMNNNRIDIRPVCRRKIVIARHHQFVRNCVNLK